MLPRVVITGLGLVTPLGCGVEASWSRLLAGQSGARRIEEFEVSDLACQIGCFVPRGALALVGSPERPQQQRDQQRPPAFQLAQRIPEVARRRKRRCGDRLIDRCAWVGYGLRQAG
jgi:3-oxoacyl-(acyl-carrier-protein) synthase